MATYAQVCRELADSLGAKASGPVDAVALKDATRFRDGLAKRVSATTTNKLLKIARVIWNDAMRDSLTTENPFAKVKRLKADSTPRRAFTEEEVQRLLAVADRDWRGMILCGIYLGQRLGDLATLTWNNIDLAKGEVFLVTRKTGKPMRRGIHEALHRHLMAMPTPDDPDAPLFPTLHGLKTETLSGQFNRIAAAAGLARTDPLHKKARKGRDARRESRGMSFHCLRHTTTSMLKNAGVSDAIAREIVGHDSEAISRQYTHIETGTMRAAINKLPDVTKNQEATR
jgi:integrase